MCWLSKAVVLALSARLSVVAAAPGTTAAVAFPPFEKWSAAVRAGSASALAPLYSIHPRPKILVGEANQVETLDNELRFWTGLRSAGITNLRPNVLSLKTAGNQTTLVLRVQAMAGKQPLFANMAQIWIQELDGWHLALSQRSEFYPDPTRRLPEPAKPNPSLYPDPRHAQAELAAALEAAKREKKRVLVVFGANWCYDCHVLDATFHSPAFAALVRANYIPVHINIGDEGKDNNDLAARMRVNLDRGIPSLAVLDPDGKVIVAQQNGEFQSSVKIGPEDVRGFLEKWKPHNK